MKCEIKNLPNQKEAAKRPTVERLVDDRPISDTLLEFAKGRKFLIRTYGCQGNVRDEEIMAGYLSKAGFVLTDDPKEANLVIINTCAVRENAEEKIYGEIGSYKANYTKDHSFMLVIAGCVMGENGVAEKLKKIYPWITLMIGTHDVHNLLPLLTECLEKKRSIIDIRSFSSEIVENMPSLRLSSFKAYVNISYGCDKFCTYCIVPYTRGRERSRKKEDIVNECRKLVEEGYKEIMLLGQNVNSYGLDLKDGTNFASLLDEVASLGVPRLKFLTSYPSQFNDEMIEVMARHDNIAKWLHFPVQSGSSSCLRRMGRRYTREEYLEVVKKIRAKMPSIALTTDIIVAFPEESEEEFEDTLSLCKEVSYSNAFTFIYSPREGTPASKMPQISREVALERYGRLKALMDETTRLHSDSMIGEVHRCLIEGPSKKDPAVLSSYAENGKLVNFKGPSYLTGCFVDVKVISNHTYFLMGEMVNDPLIEKAKDVAYLMSIDPLLKEYRQLLSSLEGDKELASLEESLSKTKKKMALSMADKEAHDSAKEEYENVLKAIKSHPALANYDSLLDRVEEELLTIKGALS